MWWLTEPFYRSRAQVTLGEYIEVMTHSYSGPYLVSMPSVVACGVDLSGIMTSMTLVRPSCLSHNLHTYNVARHWVDSSHHASVEATMF
jgi:hypothetical protein